MFIEHRFSQLVVGTSKPIEVGLFFSNIKSTGGVVFKTGDQVNPYLNYDWCSVLTHVDNIRYISYLMKEPARDCMLNQLQLVRCLIKPVTRPINILTIISVKY